MRSRTKMLITAAMAAGLAAATIFTANAANIADGQWCTGTGADASKYWFTLAPDGSSCVANTWMWIKDSDGVIRCYYFDANGWMLANTTVGGEQLDANGRWVVDGAVQTKTDAEVDYYTHNAAFINSGNSNTQSQQPTQNQTQTPATTGKGGTIKSTGAGDNPAHMETPALGYAVSSVSGKTITNSWANFTMTFPATSGTITVGAADEGFDVQNITSDAQLTIRYAPISQYGGNTLDSFVAGFVKDGRDGMLGATMGSDVTFGDFTFKHVMTRVPHPRMTAYDHAYIRVVDGTGYVQIVIVEQNGSSEDFSSTLNTMRKLA